MIDKKKKRRTIELIIICTIFILFILPSFYIKYKIKDMKENVEFDKFINLNKKIYFISDAIKINGQIESSNEYNIVIQNVDQYNITYEDNLIIKTKIKDDNIKNFNLQINNKEYNIDNNEQEYGVKLAEGKNNIEIILKDNNEEIKKINKDIYYVKEYQKQFADKLNLNGYTTHYAKFGTDSITDENIKLLKENGIKIVRDDIVGETFYKNGKFDYSKADRWINKLYENEIELIPIFWPVKKITNQEALDLYIKMITEFAKRYPEVKKYELLNEPNYSYNTEDLVKWTAKTEVEANKALHKINPEIEVYGQGISYVGSGTNAMKLDEYYKNLMKNNEYKKIRFFSYHIYEWGRTEALNCDYTWANNNFNIMLNNNGGFYKKNITEFGMNTVVKNEEQQAYQEVQQNVINKYFNINANLIYNFRDCGTDKSNYEHNYGVVDYNWHPKKAYYSLKKYYEYSNGSEYIGKLKISEGTESHIYFKGLKSFIIIWATDENKPVTIDYKDFDASDLYGNAIKNTNGKLEITSSPVYLDNISANYFYQAISNSIIDGYSEFKNKFKDEISKVNELNEKIDNLSNEAKNIYSLSEVDENIANNLMKKHFDLGNDLINAYNNGSLKVEYVKLSSMLDSLNTIGNSYEDLVTISAKTRMTDLSEITNEINRAKTLAEDNEQFDIVYPNKIYKFAQDLLDTSSYILGLDEENDIKTGLINSKALHAKYLANWSQEFSKIYIKDALKTSTNSIIEKNETIKNNNKVIYENPNVKRSYDKLQNSIKTLIENPETNNVDVVYLNQINIAKTIMTEAIAKTINIQRDDYKKIICNILNISDDYRTLYNYYIKSDEIDRTQIKNNINKIINRYNDNLDISILSSETEMIKQVKALYDNSTETDKISDNYLNKQRILQTCDIISQMLENDIKQHAYKEFTQITKSSNHDLNKYTNQDEIITINLPNDKAKIADNNGENSITFSKNDSKTIKINIRGYEYDYKIEVTNIDKSYPTLNVQKEGTAITPNATDNNLDKIAIMKDGKEIKYNIGSTITEPGIYDITAIDKAGNKVNTKSIVYGTFTNEQNVEEKYVPVLPGQKTQSIIENSEYSIANNKQQKSGNDLVATGDKLKTQNDTYIVIVKGDITGAGKADIMSLIQLRKNIVGLKNFTRIQQLASDINSDGRTNSIDLVSERKLIVGKE